MYVNQKMGIKKIGDYFGVSNTPISRVLHEHNVVRSGAEDRYNAIHTLNQYIFDKIDTEDKAWLLGFIVSDGHISKRNNIMFSQSIEQRDALEHVRRIFNSDATIKYKTAVGFGVKTEACTFTITSKYISERLRMMGLNNNKSNGYDFQKLVSYIPDDLVHHFLRGLFDGDGSIKYYNYPYCKKTTVHVGFTHTKAAVEYWWKYFQLNTKLVKETENIYTAVTSNRFKAEAIYHALYADANTYLQIKKDTFEEFLIKFHNDEAKHSKTFNDYN